MRILGMFSTSLHQRIKDLEQENKSLKERLNQKQTQINQCNAYWKTLNRRNRKKV